jgi:hypothetical protein
MVVVGFVRGSSSGLDKRPWMLNIDQLVQPRKNAGSGGDIRGKDERVMDGWMGDMV